MLADGRNTLPGIAKRVHKNLAFLSSARSMGADVHIVTQLLMSLLGLIVFPVEELRRDDKAALQDVQLASLCDQGWPAWSFGIGESMNLGNLLLRIRNALSHHRLVFSSDSRQIEDVWIIFSDRRDPAGPDDWEATISATDLKTFVELLSEFLAERIYSP